MIIDCPHCDSRVDCTIHGEVQEETEYGGPPSKVVLLQCKICHNPLLGITEILQVGENEYDWDYPGRLWPEPETNLDWGIPEISRNSLVEAKLCFKAKAYSASAVMCGRAIEGVCHHYDPNVQNLHQGLQNLKKEGIVDERIYNWSEALRLSRNLGAHATTEKVSREDAHDLLDFALAICEYVFVLNEKFERFQKRQKIKAKS